MADRAPDPRGEREPDEQREDHEGRRAAVAASPRATAEVVGDGIVAAEEHVVLAVLFLHLDDLGRAARAGEAPRLFHAAVKSAALVGRMEERVLSAADGADVDEL